MPKAVLSGSFRRDQTGLRDAFLALSQSGCDILSPKHLDFSKENDGFVFFKGQEAQTPKQVEEEHLQAILEADFVWLHCPDGYVGTSGAFEIGFARACCVPVFSSVIPTDVTIGGYINVVESPARAVEHMQSVPVRMPPALRALQSYYARVAAIRGYSKESLRDCLLLALEEMGELAHAVRKQENMIREHPERSNEVGQEVADVMLYLVHFANIAGIDLREVLMEKEKMNRDRFLTKGK